MNWFDEEDKKKPKGFVLGDNLDGFNKEELMDLIAVLEEEIKRAQTMMERKKNAEDQAAAFFKS